MFSILLDLSSYRFSSNVILILANDALSGQKLAVETDKMETGVPESGFGMYRDISGRYLTLKGR